MFCACVLAGTGPSSPGVTTACFQHTSDESGTLKGLAVMFLANFQAHSLPQGKYDLAIAHKIDH